MKKKNIEYCIYCGTENKPEDKKCIKCHKKLNPKDRPILEYLKSKIKDDVKGTLEDNIFSVIKKYIKSNLYGFILTCSVIASVTCIVVNAIDSSYIQKVTEKPVLEQLSYSGTGLTALEVAEVYVKALDEGNTKIVKSLWLETSYPNIIKDLEEYSLNNPDTYPKPILEHNLVDNREILLKNNVNTPYVGRDDLVVSPEGYFGEYHYLGFFMSIPYCSYNTCREENGETYYDYYATEEIQLIEVDGNYYVLGEKVGVIMSVDGAVKRKALFMNDGDTTNLSFDKVMEDFDNCNSDETCLEELGYTDIYSY